MSDEIKVGARLTAPGTGVQVVVVRLGRPPTTLESAGREFVPSQRAAADAPPPTSGPEVLLGKRYADQHCGIELLCVHGGVGPLRCESREMQLRTPKPLPASD